MQLEEYWGIGPKTKAILEESIGTEAAIAAIESADVRTLVEAGVDRSRATRILRHAQSADGMAILATRDARSIYKELIGTIAAYAVNAAAADRIRTLTPLTDRDAIEERLDAVERGRAGWEAMDEGAREAVLAAFERYDEAESGRLAAVEAAVELDATGVSEAVFDPIGDLDVDALADAAVALDALGGGRIANGADEELDRLRDARETVDRLSANTDAIIEELRSGGVTDTSAFRESLTEYLRRETAVDSARIRGAMADGAVDASGFVSETLRNLYGDLEGAVEERTETVRAELEGAIEAAGGDIERAQLAVTTIAQELSLGRFAAAYDLQRPRYTDSECLAVVGARNLSLLEADADVQPITYAVGDHGIETNGGPGTERVTVLTGANSGGKTTLLETLCEIAILGHMGLPVPAERAELSVLDRLVFHRRHASFNAGVLESTLQSVVPPLVSGGRTLMLVDEFEAITEPGRAADLLGGLVRLTIDEGAIGTFVTHLADDLEPLPEAARTDGIFARGLTDDLELEVDYQPRFGEVGRSTPEFIVSRLVANAGDRAEEAGFRTLAGAIDTEIVQRTLSDAEWTALDRAE